MHCDHSEQFVRNGFVSNSTCMCCVQFILPKYTAQNSIYRRNTHTHKHILSNQIFTEKRHVCVCVCDPLTVFSSFSNTSLASSKLHTSSLHSRSRLSFITSSNRPVLCLRWRSSIVWAACCDTNTAPVKRRRGNTCIILQQCKSNSTRFGHCQAHDGQ